MKPNRKELTVQSLKELPRFRHLDDREAARLVAQVKQIAVLVFEFMVR